MLSFTRFAFLRSNKKFRKCLGVTAAVTASVSSVQVDLLLELNDFPSDSLIKN